MRNLKFTAAFVGVALALALFCGCSSFYSLTRAKPGEISDFLPHHELLERQPDTFPFHYFYMNRNFKPHKNVYVAPVNVSHLKKSENWAKVDEALAGSLGSDVDKLALEMRSIFVEEISKLKGENAKNIVDSPNHPDTVVLQLAIIAIVPTKAELNYLGLAGNLLLPGISAITFQLASGSLAVECLVTDSKTGEILAMYSDVERDPMAVLPISNLTWYSSARKNAGIMAKYCAKFVGNRNPQSVKRDFPLKLISY